MLKYQINAPQTSSGGNTDTTGTTGVANYNGYIFITNAEAVSGNISNKIYDSDTVPSDVVLKECTTDNSLVRVHFIAEGGKD